jgi:hypothetical protein
MDKNEQTLPKHKRDVTESVKKFPEDDQAQQARDEYREK